LDNIQQMLAQLMVNRNAKDTSSNHDEEKYNNDKHLKTEKSKESSLIDQGHRRHPSSDCMPTPEG